MRDDREGLWLARIYQDAGAFDLAERVLQECLDQAGYAPDVWIARMRYLTATDQRSRGPNELARMARDMPKEREPLTRARCLDALHEVDQASQAFREALEASPEDFIVLSHAADFFDRADLSADAQKLYQRLLNDPAAPAEVAVPARRRLAILLATHGNAAAHKQALALLAANSSYADIADERIRLYAQSFAAPTTRSIVLDQFRQTLRRSPLKPDDRILYARMLEDGNLLIPACAQLAEAVSQRPRSPQYIARYIHLLIRTEDLDEAARQMKQLEKLEPDSQRTRNARAALARAGEAK
jgi:tetratricopeptide (TPR) repeat protein